jgi:hypothetical protein
MLRLFELPDQLDLTGNIIWAPALYKVQPPPISETLSDTRKRNQLELA